MHYGGVLHGFLRVCSDVAIISFPWHVWRCTGSAWRRVPLTCHTPSGDLFGCSRQRVPQVVGWHWSPCAHAAWFTRETLLPLRRFFVRSVRVTPRVSPGGLCFGTSWTKSKTASLKAHLPPGVSWKAIFFRLCGLSWYGVFRCRRRTCSCKRGRAIAPVTTAVVQVVREDGHMLHVTRG